MADVRFTPHLRRFFDLPDTVSVDARTVADLVSRLDEAWPGLGFYITDETGALRRHVAIWVDGKRVQDHESDVGEDSEVHILQALSGG